MVDPIGLSMSLSAAEVKALTGWPDPMVEDYLNIIQRLIDYANALTELQIADSDDQSLLADQAARAGFAAARLNSLYSKHLDLEQVVEGSSVALARIKALICENQEMCDDSAHEIDSLRGMLAGVAARLARIERAHGWAIYSDTTYTSGSPWTLTGGTAATLPNDAGDNIITFMPPNVDAFYDGSQIRPAQVGDYYILTVRMRGEYNGALPIVEFRIDIGAADELFKETLTFPKGTGVSHPFSIVVPFYSLDTFLANGGTIELESLSGGDVDFWGIEYQINRVFAAV